MNKVDNNNMDYQKLPADEQEVYCAIYALLSNFKLDKENSIENEVWNRHRVSLDFTRALATIKGYLKK